MRIWIIRAIYIYWLDVCSCMVHSRFWNAPMCMWLAASWEWGGLGRELLLKFECANTFSENLISNQNVWSLCVPLSITLKEHAIQTCDICNCWCLVGSALLEGNLTTVCHIFTLFRYEISIDQQRTFPGVVQLMKLKLNCWLPDMKRVAGNLVTILFWCYSGNGQQERSFVRIQG